MRLERILFCVFNSHYITKSYMKALRWASQCFVLAISIVFGKYREISNRPEVYD